MNIKFLTIFLSLALIANPVFAEENEEMPDFGLDEPVVETTEEVIETVEEIPNEIADNSSSEAQNVEVPAINSQKAPILQEEEIIVEKAEPQESAAEIKEEKANTDSKSLQQQLDENQIQLSNYVKALNLQTSQLDTAKEISEEGRLRQMQLMQSIEQLKNQVKSLENKNLEKFKKILTPEQLEVFNKLQNTYENNLNIKEQLNKTAETSSSAR